MPFRFKKIHTYDKAINKLPPADVLKDDEGLTGFIGNMKASDIEERFARALEKNKLAVNFRVQIMDAGGQPRIASNSQRNTLGVIEIDFLVPRVGILCPYNIDGQFSHKTAEQTQTDRDKDTKLDYLLRSWGSPPMKRVPYFYLNTQEDADRYVRENVR